MYAFEYSFRCLDVFNGVKIPNNAKQQYQEMQNALQSQPTPGSFSLSIIKYLTQQLGNYFFILSVFNCEGGSTQLKVWMQIKRKETISYYGHADEMKIVFHVWKLMDQ